MKRKLAEHDNLKVTIEQTGDQFQIKESSTFRTKDIDFTLGVPFDYSLADGTEVSVSQPKRQRGMVHFRENYGWFADLFADGGRVENKPNAPSQYVEVEKKK